MTASDTTSDAYFVRESATRLRPTKYVGGAWNPAEYHVAPLFGALAHAIEGDAASRGRGGLQVARVTFDILGVLPVEPVDIEVELVRPGRTIELVSAVLSHAGRPAVVARAWLAAEFPTSHMAGTDLPGIPGPGELQPAQLGSYWYGEFVRSLELRRGEWGPGRATSWVRTGLDLVQGEKASATTRVIGLIDVANGVSPRVAMDEAAFPNLDLTAHFFRVPVAGWLGLDTTVSFGPTGLGVTHCVLHDEHGPFGTVMQALTVRPVPRDGGG